MKQRSLWIGLLAGLLSVLPVTVFAQAYKIGVLAGHGPVRALDEWKATADYLGRATGQSFEIVPLDYEQLPQWVKQKKIDFVLTNSAMYSDLNRECRIRAIATRISRYADRPTDRCGALIFVRRDSKVAELSDLKGKSFGCASRSAFGGWLMTVLLMQEQGLNTELNSISVRELKTHENVIYAVLNGAVDAGSVPAGLLEKLVREGRVQFSDFKTVHPVTDDFPLLHSTRLYPEAPMAVCPHVPMEVATLVANALVSTPASDGSLAGAGIAGWEEPLEYGPVAERLARTGGGASQDAVREEAPASVREIPEKPAPPPEPARVKTVVRSSKRHPLP